MKSQNFEFLRPKREVLADLAGFAERYAHQDPASSLIKQRTFVEHVVTAIYEAYRLLPPYSDNLNDLLTAEAFRQSVPEVVQNKLHAVRKAGNHAAHPRRPITSQLSLDSLDQLFDIARWFGAAQETMVSVCLRLGASTPRGWPPQRVELPWTMRAALKVWSDEGARRHPTRNVASNGEGVWIPRRSQG